MSTEAILTAADKELRERVQDFVSWVPKELLLKMDRDEVLYPKEFLQEAFGYAGLDWKKHVKIDKRYFRPTEVDCLIGGSSKARRKLKWKPPTYKM
jgi:GDP-D-mannose dehydratase